MDSACYFVGSRENKCTDRFPDTEQMHYHLHFTRKITWDNSIASNLPEVTYKAVMESDKGLAEWLNNIVSLRRLAINEVVIGDLDTLLGYY
jgi:hypothetical protein